MQVVVVELQADKESQCHTEIVMLKETFSFRQAEFMSRLRLFIIAFTILATPTFGGEAPVWKRSGDGITFIKGLLAEAKSTGSAPIIANAYSPDGKSESNEDIVKCSKEWVEMMERGGWKTVPVEEYGDELVKMVILERGKTIDPIFISRKSKDSNWTIVLESCDENQAIGAEKVKRYRDLFEYIETTKRRKDSAVK
jgi:hypothetical protein